MSVSIIIPCLNEEGSIEECVRRAHSAFEKMSPVEVLVADNGSTDRSRELALNAGARVVEERRLGYGSAILVGLQAAQYDYVVIGDADNTYDFRDAVLLVEELQKGADFAIGDRINGQVEKGAMPWLHQHIGTPVLTWILNRFFGTRVHDINCGLRAIRRSAVPKLKLRSPGMEFASEMVIHAQKAGLRFAELPIRYYRRHFGQAKLRTFHDGWRHLRFILLCAPLPLFLLPAVMGVVLMIYFYQSERFGFQVLGSFVAIVSFQLFFFGLFAKAYLWVTDAFLVDQKVGRLLSYFQLEYGLLTALVVGLFGVFLFSRLDLSSLIQGSTFIALGVQIFFSSFLLSILMFKKKDTI